MSHRVLALSALILLLAVQTPLGAQTSKRDQEIIKQFKDRVDAYRKLHDQAKAKAGPVPKTESPAQITNRQHALGEAIRAARVNARQGDIFTPATGALLRRIIERDLTHRKQVDRRAFVVEQPDITVHVNDFYPTTVPLATVPPAMLKELPVLPDGLEYRFAGTALILRDVDPNLVVDVLPDAIPARFRQKSKGQAGL